MCCVISNMSRDSAIIVLTGAMDTLDLVKHLQSTVLRVDVALVIVLLVIVVILIERSLMF